MSVISDWTVEEILEFAREDLERVERQLTELADQNTDMGFYYGLRIGQQIELKSIVERLESVK